MADAKRCDRCGAYYSTDEKNYVVSIAEQVNLCRFKTKEKVELCTDCLIGLERYLTMQREDQHEQI